MSRLSDEKHLEIAHRMASTYRHDVIDAAIDSAMLAASKQDAAQEKDHG